MKSKHFYGFLLLGCGFILNGYLLFLTFSWNVHMGILMSGVFLGYSALFLALITFSISPYLSPKLREKLLWSRAVILDFFLQSYVMCFLFFLNHKKLQVKGDGTPIFLVHGYIHPSSVWLHLMRTLKKAGFGPINVVKLGSPFDSIEEYAEKLGVTVEEVLKENKKDQFMLIGHSMGGLVSAYYATHLDKEKRVTHVITISSPLKGTRIAKIGIGKSVAEMNLDSPFTEKLMQDIKKEKKMRVFNIGSKTDQIIVPYTSSFIYDDHAHSLVLDGVGHIGVLFSRKVYKKIMEWLRTPSKD